MSDRDQTSLMEYAMLAPRLGKLIWGLMRDPRVPSRSKATLVFVAGYLISPLDFIPSFVPGLGQLDDLILAALALDQVINRVPYEVVQDHWDGNEDLLNVVREVLEIATSFVPRWLKNRLASGSDSV
jgi:uncharacterized membrane protein YkvA (DUF1232 family)